MNLSRLAVALGLALLLGAATGCGSDGRVVIKGKLVDGGSPFVLDEKKLKLPPGGTGLPPGARPLMVTFIAAEGPDKFQANVSADTGTFDVPGTDGKGIKPGRYKIAVTASVGGADYFNGKFSPEKTQIVRDVTATEEVVIDVSKPQG